MSGKMSLSALLYFAAHPGVNDDDIFARLTGKNIRDVGEDVISRKTARSPVRCDFQNSKRVASK